MRLNLLHVPLEVKRSNPEAWEEEKRRRPLPTRVLEVDLPPIPPVPHAALLDRFQQK